MYLGDSQNGLEEWSKNYQEAVDRHPEVRFMLLAGDIVNHGDQRAEYDAFFGGAARAFARVPFVPVLGNHDHIGAGATLYAKQFVLPEGGPVKPEHCYAFEYGPALVVVLDSTSHHALDEQARWLDGVLAASSAPWKLVSFHHPVWSSLGERDNVKVRAAFAPVMEKHGVAMSLNGHDHAYARTAPMRGGEPAEDGTVYVVTVSGSKMYPQDRRPIFSAGMTDTATYQLITVSKDSIVYSARTWDGVEVDHYERRAK
jgi:3',5'-cyclic AMP phosphodiesterase CpdA